MSGHVYKTIEVTGSSSEGLGDAVNRAVNAAAKTVRNLDWFELGAVRGEIVDGKIAFWQASVKIGFRLEE